MMLLPLHSAGSSCWTRKNGARTFTAKRLSKSSIWVSSMLAVLEMPALATRMSSRSPTIARTRFASRGGPSPGPRGRPPRLPQVGPDLLGAAAALADFGDDRVCLLLAVAVVDQYLGTGPSQGQGTGAAHAARGAGNESCFSRKRAHYRISWFGAWIPKRIR